MERLDLLLVHRLQGRFALARPRVRMIAEQRAPELLVGEKLR
jgi:hypothetical protein